MKSKSNDRKEIRRRLAPEEREEQIILEASRFFADEGFGGQTRELARRLGTTQPLLYRYFESKEELIDSVYQHVFVGRWKDEWEEELKRRDKPLKERLLTVYTEYAEVADNREWVRILLLAGIKGESFNRQYLETVQNRLVEPICAEMRHQLGLATPDEQPIGDAERDLVWSFHGAFFYRGIRRWVYGLKVSDDGPAFVHHAVETFLAGASASFASLVAPPNR